MGKKVIGFFCLLLMLLFLLFPFSDRKPVVAQSSQEQGSGDLLPFELGGDDLDVTETINPLPDISNTEGFAFPDLANFSFADLPFLPEGGGVDFNQLDPDVVAQLGYDPSVFWQAGDRVENILNLGSLAPYTSLANWTLSTIGQYVPEAQWASVPLNAAMFLSNHSIEDIVDAVPLLGGYKLGDVKPIYDVLASKFNWSTLQGNSLAKLPLSRISDSVFGTVKFDFGNYDLSSYVVSDIPNLDSMPFSNLVKWEEIKIGDIPFLNVVSWGRFGLGILDLFTTSLAKVDIVFGEAEGNQAQKGRESVTGSYKEGFAVPCDEDSCSYLELTDAFFPGSIPLVPSVHGKQWISGKSQWVDGGEGFLIGGKEPTGRNPFGPVFKVVMTEAKESEGKAEFSLYFRLCFNFFGVGGCTPYILGPFPWFPAHEGDIILLGLDGGENGDNGSNAPRPSREELLEMLEKLNPALAAKVKQLAQQQPDYGDPGHYEDAIDTTANCTKYQGVHLGYLRQAIANVESRGSGDYDAVGTYVIADSGRNRGRALGKYQVMSYEPEIIQYIGPQPGGPDFLAKIRDNQITEAEIKTKMRKLFPPALQEKVVEMQFKRRIDTARAKVTTMNERSIVYNLAGWYNPLNDGLNQGYAQRVTDYYVSKDVRSKVNQQCKTAGGKGQCKGKFVVPAKGIKTSGFGMRWGRSHNGVDIANAVGTSIVAADGGVVTSAFKGCPKIGTLGDTCGGGFGNHVYIKHCNGSVTRYAHLNSLSVKTGQKVRQGQLIGGMGTSGSSTGVHLHFEIRLNGTQAVDPEKYLPKF